MSEGIDVCIYLCVDMDIYAFPYYYGLSLTEFQSFRYLVDFYFLWIILECVEHPPLAPPPWLIHMQRWGPPPAYPNLRIPGLNAPIPVGAQWGFHPGGWGKPPVDEVSLIM